MFLDPASTPGAWQLERIVRPNWREIRLDAHRLIPHFSTWPEPLHNGGWSVFPLKWQGEIRHGIYPWLYMRRILNAGFSLLEPGTEITPHVGYTDKVLRYHVGLDCVKGCGIRVGDEVREWKAGESLLFDDTQEHSAWNRGDGPRLILLVDIIRE